LRLKTEKKGLADYFRSYTHPDGIVVCEEKKFVYMRPAKTAGTSILRSTLEKKISGIITAKDHPEKFNQWLENITDNDLNDYFIFAVVRNPWDRAVSSAVYLDLELSDLLHNFEHHSKTEKKRIHTLPLSIYTHCNNKLFTDFICRYECLQADMNLVFDALGIDRQELPWVNKSKRKNYTDYYTQAEIVKVAELYQSDIKNFGYAFDPKPSVVSYTHTESVIINIKIQIKKLGRRLGLISKKQKFINSENKKN